MPGGLRCRIHVGVGVIALVSGGDDARCLRPMSIDDLAQVLEIEAQWSPRPWSRSTFENELGIPFSRAAVLARADRPTRIVGYFVRWLVGEELRLLSLAVRDDARRAGLGGWLLDDLLREAREGRCRRAILEVAETNSAARALYGSRGFRGVGRRPDYYGPGQAALVLELPIGRAVS